MVEVGEAITLHFQGTREPMAKNRTAEEEELRERFGQFYSETNLPVNQRVELAVCGCCYGGVSWATRDEIDEVSAMLDLGPGDRLMDLGAGTGWPGLYLAEASGCDVVLTDLPLEGLVIAAERARSDDLPGAVHLAVADGQSLPCADKSFDALTHSDVLCCLPDKLDVLRECRRVICDDGQMIFSVIYGPQDLDDRSAADLMEAGPPYVASDMSYEDMLAQSGWALKAKIDKTDEYLDSIRSFFRVSAESEDELVRASGIEDFEMRMNREPLLVECIERRHLLRALYQVTPI